MLQRIRRAVFGASKQEKYAMLATQLVAAGIRNGFAIIEEKISPHGYSANRLAIYSELACFYIHWTARSSHTLNSDELFGKSFTLIFSNVVDQIKIDVEFENPVKKFTFERDLFELLEQREVHYATLPSLARENERYKGMDLFVLFPSNLADRILPYLDLENYDSDTNQKFIVTIGRHLFSGGFSGLEP